MAFRGSRFVFLVPLKARASSFEWSAVIERFHATLGSFLNQTKPDWRMVVACQDDPLGAAPDTRMEWLKIETPPPPAGEHAKGLADKYRKMARLGLHLREHGADDVYAMIVDGDDLIHRDVVGHVLKRDNRRGWLGEIGYRYDFITGRLALLDPPKRPLVTLCGSTCAAYYGHADFPNDARDRQSHFVRMTRHAEVIEHAEAAGRPLEAVPFPAVVYRVNHRDSQQFIKRGAKREHGTTLDDPETSVILARDFGWTNLARPADAPALNPADAARRAMSREERQEQRRLRRVQVARDGGD